MLSSDEVANVEHFKWQQWWDFWVFGPTCLYTLIEGNTQRLPFTTGWAKAERRSKEFLFHLDRGSEPFLAGKMNPWLPATRRCAEYSVALTARFWLSIALRGAIYTRQLHGPTGRWGARDHLVTCKWGPLHCHTERRCEMSLLIFHHHPSLFWSATDIDLQPLFFPSNHRTRLEHDFPNCQMAPPPKANSSPFYIFHNAPLCTHPNHPPLETDTAALAVIYFSKENAQHLKCFEAGCQEVICRETSIMTTFYFWAG